LVWKLVNNSDPGTVFLFGGDDVDKISRMFNGALDVDSVDINSLWKFRDTKIQFANPANTFNYNLRTSAIITNDKDILLPLLLSNDTFVF